MSVLEFKNIPFIIFFKTPYIGTRSNLSWVKPAMVELAASIRNKCTIQQTRHILKLLRPILI